MLLLSHFRLTSYIPIQNEVKRKGTSVSWAWPTNIYNAVVLSVRVTLHTSLNKSNCFDSDMTLRTFILFLKLANCFSFKQYSSVGTYWTTFKCLMTQSSFSHSYIHPSKYSEFTKYLQRSEVFNLHISLTLTLMRPIIKF